MKFIGVVGMTGMILAVISGCGSSGRVDGNGGGGGSDLTAINIALPDRNNLKNQVADIETKMNGFHFVVTPADAGCAGATKVDELADYKNAASLGASLKQGCDYDVSLQLGNKAAAQAQPAQPAQPALPAAPSYEGKIKSIIDGKCISCHPGARPSDLRTYSGAKRHGADSASRIASGNMPMGGSLSQADKDAFKAWADAGFPEKDAPAANPPSPSPAQPAPAGKLGAVYYKNNAVLRIKKEDIQGKASYKVTLPLQLQADGRAIGLGSASASPNTGGSQAQPSQPAQPQPPAAPAAQIPADRDFDLKDASGKSAKLSSHFKGKYMLIDFSASNCGYCRQRAGEMNRDQNLQKLLTGDKCSAATVVPANDLDQWLEVTGGANVFTGKHSYEATNGNLGRLAKAFGVNFIGTPTFLLIDAQGKVLADSNGIPTEEINQYCK